MSDQQTRTRLIEIPRFCPDCGRSASRAESALCDRCGATLVIQGYCPVCESRLCGAVGSPCPKHDVELLADDVRHGMAASPGASGIWTTVRRFPDTMAAAAARIRLEAEGIPTFVEGERMGAPAMYRVATGGVKLQVPADLTAEARIILDQGWSWPEDDLEPEDEPPDINDSAQLSSPRWSLFAIEMAAVLTAMAVLAAWLLFHAFSDR